MFLCSFLEEISIGARDIREAIKADSTLSLVLKYTMEGWPRCLDQSQHELRPYFNQKEYLSVEQGCILLGYRVIIPAKYHGRLLNELHNDYPGICKMKALARSHLWWPSLDKDIEAKAKSCFVCCAVQNTPQSAPLHPWTWPSRIWQRLHIDYAQKGNSNFLVVIDSYSKWLEVFETRNTSAESTCDMLCTLFASFGLPEEVVSDNGPQFTSSVFKSFLKNNGVKQTLTPPYHPASNGAAERSVQILKRSLTKQVLHSRDKLSTSRKLVTFLFTYRNT